MAKIVEVMGVGHNPFLPRLFQNAEQYPGIPTLKERYGEFRQKLREAQPDVLFCISHDHLNELFMDNMPAFLLSKAPIAEGPFSHQEKQFGVPHYRTHVDVEVAKRILEGGLQRGIDFSYSDEFHIDHAYAVPLSFLRPEMDLPIIPLSVNCMAPPVPTAARCYQVGQILKTVLEEDVPADCRVAVVASGHLGIELGGPKVMNGPLDAEWELHVTDLIRQGEVETLIRESTPERFMSIGNYTFGFVDYLVAMGLAGGRPAVHAEPVFSCFQTQAFISWGPNEEAVK
ncbi:MAG TPA: hypothetical protein VNL15_00090 [Dehalococcoidia bacterium]|nr:hypothetical protein [Dehalococcoidia bacterium]